VKGGVCVASGIGIKIPLEQLPEEGVNQGERKWLGGKVV